MTGWNIPGNVQTSLDTVDDMLRQQHEMLNDIQNEPIPGNVDDTYTAPAPKAGFDAIVAELDALFANDQDLAARLNSPSSSAPKPFTPLSIDEITRSFNETAQNPVPESNAFGPSAVEQTDSARKPPVVQQEPHRGPSLEELLQPFREEPEPFVKRRGNKNPSTNAAITDQQLRALNRKHLLIMIRDLEKELRQKVEEIDNMLLAYQAGIAQQAQVG